MKCHCQMPVNSTLKAIALEGSRTRTPTCGRFSFDRTHSSEVGSAITVSYIKAHYSLLNYYLLRLCHYQVTHRGRLFLQMFIMKVGTPTAHWLTSVWHIDNFISSMRKKKASWLQNCIVKILKQRLIWMYLVLLSHPSFSTSHLQSASVVS